LLGETTSIDYESPPRRFVMFSLAWGTPIDDVPPSGDVPTGGAPSNVALSGDIPARATTPPPRRSCVLQRELPDPHLQNNFVTTAAFHTSPSHAPSPPLRDPQGYYGYSPSPFVHPSGIAADINRSSTTLSSVSRND
jgi:hypothetical protein